MARNEFANSTVVQGQRKRYPSKSLNNSIKQLPQLAGHCAKSWELSEQHYPISRKLKVNSI